jgi:hypothetical protein
MKHYKYRVRIAIPDSEPLEYDDSYFYNREEVCKFLEISLNTFIAMTEGRLKYNHSSKKHLSNVIIERLPIKNEYIIHDNYVKNVKSDTVSDTNAYLSKLHQKNTIRISSK